MKMEAGVWVGIIHRGGVAQRGSLDVDSLRSILLCQRYPVQSYQFLDGISFFMSGWPRITSHMNYNTPLIDDLNHEEELDPSVVVDHYCQCWKKFIRRGEVYVFFSAGGGELREWMVAIVLFVYRKTYSKLLCIFFFFFHSYLCRLMRLHSWG